MRLFALILCFLFLYSDIAASKEWMFDSFTGEDYASLSSDLVWLNHYRNKKNNRWFYDNLNLRSGNGSDLYSYIRSRLPFIKGDASNFGLCSVNSNQQPICGPDSVFQNNLDNPTLIKAFPGPFFIWIPYVDLKENNINGGVLLSNGGALPVDGIEDMIVVYNHRLPRNLNLASLRIFRIAHLAGLSAASDNIRLQIAPYSKCSNGIVELNCQKLNVGFFSVAGLLLRDMSIDCTDCNLQDKLALSYFASSYLLRCVNNKKLVRAGYKILSNYEKQFDEAGMDTEFLKKIYRQSLLN